MDLFLQQTVNAFALGGTYALLALGLAMVFSTMGLINFAHGELMTIAGYILMACGLAGVPAVRRHTIVERRPKGLQNRRCGSGTDIMTDVSKAYKARCLVGFRSPVCKSSNESLIDAP